MNPRRWAKGAIREFSRSCVAIFGATASGVWKWGTGLLVEFRGRRLALTCAHVLDAIVDPVFVTRGRYTQHTQRVYSVRHSDASADWGCLVLRDAADFDQKVFISASDALLRPVAREEPVVLYGFPIGHPKLQTGGIIDPLAAEARFRSMSYVTLTGVSMTNDRLGRIQPKVDWTPGSNVDLKRFDRVGHNLSKHERQGFSGGPVFLANSRRLIGQITDASDYSMFYNPMDLILSGIDKTL